MEEQADRQMDMLRPEGAFLKFIASKGKKMLRNIQRSTKGKYLFFILIIIIYICC
jgi:hypothetical protein